MQNPHGFQQQQHAQVYQANPQLLQAQQQQGQQMPQAMYGIPQQHGMQYLQQQQALQAGGRAAAQGLPQQQLQGLHGMQQHAGQHQQQPNKPQDDNFDIMDIPSDDEAAEPAAPVGRPGAAAQQSSSGPQQGGVHPALALPQQHQQQFVPTHMTPAQLQQLAASGRAGVAASQQQQQQQQQQHQQARHQLQQQQLQQQSQALGQRPAQAMQPAAPANRHMSNVHAPRQSLPPAPAMAGTSIPPHLQQQLAAQQKLQQQQQQLLAQQKAALGAQQAAAGRPAAAEPLAKRPKTADALPPAPDDAQSLFEVMYKAERAGVLKPGAGAAGAAGSSLSAAAAAAGSAADGPCTSIDDILRRTEQHSRSTAEAAALARARGIDRPGGADDDKLISEAGLKRLMELQTLNKAFKLQPDLVEQLQQLTESFVSEAVKFGVDLASHRRGATLRPTDLATYLERTHHLHVPGFTKEYHPYRRPLASELHRERSIAVRKAQLAAVAAGGGDAPTAAAAAARGGGGD